VLDKFFFGWKQSSPYFALYPPPPLLFGVQNFSPVGKGDSLDARDSARLSGGASHQIDRLPIALGRPGSVAQIKHLAES
jgi:hypothetical protein